MDKGLGAKAGHDLAFLSAALGQRSEAMDGIVQEILEAIDAIAGAMGRHEDRTREVAGRVDSILKQVSRNGDAAAGTGEAAGRLEHLADKLRGVSHVFALGGGGERALEMHSSMPDIVRAAARSIEQALEGVLARREITEDELFDDDYRPIPGTRPQKFRTRFDGLTDRLFPPLQEPLLDRHPGIVYAGAVDRSGYFPTHNLRFSKPLTGDPAVDLVHNRTKRIFDDPVGRRCGNHQLPFLLQTYRRDSGEIMHDISAPIRVRGRQWGGFRIGYRAV